MVKKKYNSPEEMPIISGGMGFGGCSVSTCSCRLFQGTWGSICTRCGHSFNAHY